MPAPDGGDDFVWIGGPCEGLRRVVVLFEEPIDGGLKVCDRRTEDAAFQPPFRQLGEEALDGVEPGAGGRREVEGEALDAGVGIMIGDLPLKFHPAATRVPGFDTPEGADVATGDRRSWSGLRSRSPVAVRLAAYSAGVA